MKKILALTLLLSIPFLSNAALSPLYQSIEEYEALLRDPHLPKIISNGEEIISIERGRRLFVVRTNQQAFEVTVIYDDVKMPGRVPFHFEFGEPELKPNADRNVIN